MKQGSEPSSRPHIHRHETSVRMNPFESLTSNMDNRSTKVPQEHQGVHALPVQEEIDLPENAWEEDLSEWYVTATQGPMSAPKQKLSALPPVPLKSTLNIRRPTVSEPEVGSVAAHLMGADDEMTSEGEDSQYDLPRPIAPPVQRVQKQSSTQRAQVDAVNFDDHDSYEQSGSQNQITRSEVSIRESSGRMTSSKPTSVSQLSEQVDELKSQARQLTAEAV